ncbi:MAG: hypothetical protein JRG71_01640 [Deltaproteobacteria bacterium]|nr:hypothetical protein [Deltaproteobacteria bacterium]
MINRSTLKTALTAAILLMSLSSVALASEDVFDQPIEPFSTLECARCHEQVFTDLRDFGGAHKMVCRDCHDTFHNFKRGLTLDERLPACEDCHEQPHGDDEAMLDCLNCHSNAHAPVASLNIDHLEPLCASCHNGPAEQLAQPSSHADMSCNECHHEQHGYLPTCIECHDEPHSIFENSASCMQCHPVHNVSIMLYSDEIPNQPCAGCHSEAFDKLEKGHLAHSELNCTFCHANEHGNVPSCEECHNTPHNPEMLAEFDQCSDCHGSPHDLLPGE